MERRIILAASIILPILVLAVSSAVVLDQESPPIVLISIDTMRDDRLTVEGYERNITPNLDQFIRNAYYFENAHANAPWTLPSHSAVFTGKYPRETGMLDWTDRLCGREDTLAEILNRNGYRTAAFNGDAAISKRFGFDQGFDIWNETQQELEKGNAQKAVKYIEDVNTTQTFLFIHGYDAHTPYAVPDSQSKVFGSAGSGPLPRTESELRELRETNTTYKELLERTNTSLGSEGLEQIKDLYDSEIYYADKSLGRVFRKLKEEKMYDPALIIFFSDHGEEFKEHGYLGHANFYSETINVPLAIKLPHQDEGRKISEMVELRSIFASVLYELDRSTARKGVPLQQVIEGDASYNSVYAERLEKKMVLTDGYKLIWEFGYSNQSTYELYNLKKDPTEQKNLAHNRTLLERINKSFRKYPDGVSERCNSGYSFSTIFQDDQN